MIYRSFTYVFQGVSYLSSLPVKELHYGLKVVKKKPRDFPGHFQPLIFIHSSKVFQKLKIQN